jgi:cytochrome P450/NADPH-cytochrome P450 reductase
MACAGTGLAPFRGFVEDRELRARVGEPTGPALLFFGCNHPQVDPALPRGAGRLAGRRRGHGAAAFFHQPDGETRFVQHRLWRERARVRDLLDRGATFYVCGDGRHMAPAVRETLARIPRRPPAAPTPRPRPWVDALEREGRYVADVFA